MQAVKIEIDGVDIIRTGIYYTSREWLGISASDESRDIAGMHARYVSPTYARVRTIALEGVIDREESDREALDHLRYLFRLQ